MKWNLIVIKFNILINLYIILRILTKRNTMLSKPFYWYENSAVQVFDVEENGVS